MKAAKLVLVAVSLLLFAGTLSSDWAEAQGRRQREAEREVEAGGWQVAYGNELTETDAEQGEVAPGVSIFAGRGTREMGVLHNWADALVRQAVGLLPPAATRDFEQEEQFQAMRFTVRTVRELLRDRRSGVKQMELNPVELKVGVLEYRGSRRDREWGSERGRRSDILFVPYVGMRAKVDKEDWRSNRDELREQREPNAAYAPPVVDSPHQYQNVPMGLSSAEVMNELSLNNTARKINDKRWEWTAYIDGPTSYLRRISSVTYYLHPSFNPSTQQGDRTRPGHPLTANGWGVFVLKAEVVLDDGTRRIYQHQLRLGQL
ncbi:hypothetical protein VU08_03760 [Desulfobulbus sp. F5]|nr:hypothetical protein [Desulfobulbus sp. F5]